MANSWAAASARGSESAKSKARASAEMSATLTAQARASPTERVSVYSSDTASEWALAGWSVPQISLAQGLAKVRSGQSNTCGPRSQHELLCPPDTPSRSSLVTVPVEYNIVRCCVLQPALVCGAGDKELRARVHKIRSHVSSRPYFFPCRRKRIEYRCICPGTEADAVVVPCTRRRSRTSVHA